MCQFHAEILVDEHEITPLNKEDNFIKEILNDLFAKLDCVTESQT